MVISDKDRLAYAQRNEKEQNAKFKELASDLKLLYENMEIKNDPFPAKIAYAASLIPASFEQFENELQNGKDLSLFDKNS